MRRTLRSLLPLLALLAVSSAATPAVLAGAERAPALLGEGVEPDWTIEAGDAAATGPSIEAAPTARALRQPQARGRRTSRLSPSSLPALLPERRTRPKRESEARRGAPAARRPIRLLIGRLNE